MTTKAQAILAAAAAFQTAKNTVDDAVARRKAAEKELVEAGIQLEFDRQQWEKAERDLAAASMMDGDEEAGIAGGDVVRLKSGGPWMTVGGMCGESAVCSWSNGPTVERCNFHVAMLEKSTD